MMNDGGPAFPQLGRTTEQYFNHSRGTTEDRELLLTNGGMSLRDWFAGKALAFVADRDMFAQSYTNEECALVILNATVLAYRIADAMLVARAATQENER